MKVSYGLHKSDEIYMSIWDIIKLLWFGKIKEGATNITLGRTK